MADNKTSIIISAEDRTRAAFESAKNGLQGLEAAANRIPVIGAALGAAFSVSALAESFKAAIEFAASMDDMAEKTGASVEELSKLAQVAKISGVSLDTVEVGLVRLSKALHSTDDESKGAAHALEAIGLSAEALRGLDTAEAMKKVADAMSRYADSSGKTAVLMDIFGKSGAQMAPYLKDLAEAGELNASLTAEQAAQAEKLEKQINALKLSSEEFSRSIAMVMVPRLNESIESFKRAREAGIGFFQAFTGIGLRDANEGVIDARINAAQHILELNQELTKLQKDQAYYAERGDSYASRDVQVDIDKVNAKLRYFKSLQADDALKRFSASYSNEGHGGGLGSLAGYVSKDGKKDAPQGKTDLQRMEELGQKNLWAAHYASDGDETMREVGEKRAIKSAEEHADALKKLAEAQQRLIDMTNGGKLDKFYEQADMAASMLQSGRIDFEQYDQIIAHLGGLQNKAKDTEDSFAELGKVIEGWGRQSSNAIAEFVVDGKGNLDDLLKSFAKEMVAMVVYQSTMKKLAEGIGSWVSSFSTTANAKGDVYDSPSLSRYSGGVYDSPRLFGFANGIGVFAEAGPEAIMPLKRGPDGKLGVSSSGGGGGGLSVTIINNTGAPVQQREVPDGRGGRKLEVQIGEAVAAQMLVPGSPANRARKVNTMIRRG